MTTSDLTDLELALEHWQTLAELQVQFVEALAQYKAESAKAELIAAVTAGEWAVARMKARIANELDAILQRLTRIRHTTAARIERFQRHAGNAAKIRDGEDLSAGQTTLMWAAFTVFERLAPAAVLGTSIDTPLHPTARLGLSYADPRHPHLTCPDPPGSVDNVHALIGWLKRRNYVPRRGTHAYRQVIEALTAIAEVAPTQIQALRQALSQLEQGTYDAWQPPVIAALPDSVDAKKIIKLK